MVNNPQPTEALDLSPVCIKSDQDPIVTAICTELENSLQKLPRKPWIRTGPLALQ